MSSKSLPNLIQDAPENLARLIFPNCVNVQTGREYRSYQMKTKPEASWNAETNGLYTLLLVDAVATVDKAKTPSQICNWLVINIPGNEISQGKVLIEYKAPTRLIYGSGLHRLIFLIFKQADIIKTENFVFKITKQGRIIVKTNDYTTRFHLGCPIAGNYYKVRDEEAATLNI